MSFVFGLVVAIQILAGAYASERGNFSDEAAHFMNGLLVRDYLRDGLGTNPMVFAERYYLNYPKIAPMMWPPLFHLVLGVVMLPGWSPHTTSLLLVAFAASWTAWRLSRIVGEMTNEVAGYIAAGLFVTTTIVVDMTSVVMLDTAVAALALEATYWFSRFLVSGARRDGLKFGIVAACCCITKGNGLFILLLPPTAMVLTGRYSLLRNRTLWLAAALVFLIALPVISYSLSLDTPMGGYSYIHAAQMRERIVYYGQELWKQFGSLVVVFAAIGCVLRSGRWFRQPSRGFEMTASMAALFISAFAFHVVTPHEAFGLRYMELAVAPVFALCATGAWVVAQWLSASRPRLVHLAVLIAVALNFGFARPAIASRGPLGYRDASKYLDATFGLHDRRIVVVSNETGEGALVSEVAAHRISPAPTLIRGSKLIAFEDWNGGGFRLNITSASALTRALEDLHVDFLIVDNSVSLSYSGLVDEMLRRYSDHFELIRTINRGRHLSIYRLRSASPGPAKKVNAEIGALRRRLTQE